METILEVSNVTKNYHGKLAVNNVSFTVRKGEITAILGPNGAGKTTLILMMLGLLKPSSGTVKLFGKNPSKQELGDKIGVMFQEVSLLDGLKVKELIHLIRSYYKQPLDVAKIYELTGLNDRELNMRTEKLSGGQKRKVNFSLALAGNPDLLFFDEPTVGMDLQSRKRFWEHIQDLSTQGKSILFSTHYLQEADDFAKRILLMKDGRLLEEGTPKELKEKMTKKSISFLPNRNCSLEKLQDLPFVTEVVEKNNRIYLFSDDTDALLVEFFARNIPFQDLNIEKGRLDEAFEQLTEEKSVAS